MNQESALTEPLLNSRRIDGRRLRSKRTKLLIIEAYLELLRKNPKQTPTAVQIAKQAGCSTRSIFEHFSNLRALNLATADYAVALGQSEAPARDVDGDRQTRIQSHAKTRARSCEKWLPLWHALTTTQDQLPELKARVVLARLGNIERMKLMYAPELSTLSTSEREQLLIALGTLISFESWDQMRDCYNLSVEAAQGIWVSMIDRVLPPVPIAGSDDKSDR
jgi:AcrR family transcriptional regulator